MLSRRYVIQRSSFQTCGSTMWQEVLMKGAFCAKRRFQYRATIGCIHCVYNVHCTRLVSAPVPCRESHSWPVASPTISSPQDRTALVRMGGGKEGIIGASGSLIKVSNNGRRPCISRYRCERWLSDDDTSRVWLILLYIVGGAEWNAFIDRIVWGYIVELWPRFGQRELC